VTWNVPLEVKVWMVYSPKVVTLAPMAREFPEEHDAATELGELEFGAPAAGDGAAGDATP